MAKQFQSLQHMRTGIIGGMEGLVEDEDRLRRHNEQLYKTLTDDEMQLEVRAENQKLHQPRHSHIREGMRSAM